MYESEINNVIQSGEEIPDDILAKFNELRDKISSKSLLPWTEHCIECVWPTCYSSCSLYDPRKDGKCRRFKNGMILIPIGQSSDEYLLKITFKKWGKLLAQGTSELYGKSEISERESRDIKIGRILQQVPAPSVFKKKLYQKRYGIKNRKAKSNLSSVDPETFVLEIYNPQERMIHATLTFRPDGSKSALPFQKLITINHGYNLFKVGSDEINISLNESFKVEITPNDIEEGNTLYFGVLDFVNFKKSKIKCVIWDLDNTLWNGTLVEDGIENLKMKDGLKKAIMGLDKAGILQSVSSKNNEKEAVEALKKFGVLDYFLTPQINWEPKSNSIKSIINTLNIGSDTVAFIDDQTFEREEVKSVFPELHILDPESIDFPDGLLNKIETKNTSESKNRRHLYRQELKRKEIAGAYEGDYFTFLKDCNLTISISALNEEKFERVHELVQRTNQMNFSGNRYSRETLEKIAIDSSKRTYVLHVNDKFGDYGIVGFGIFDVERLTLIDLTFSCRVQSKRVEHAFISWFLKETEREFDERPKVVFNETPRNAPSGKVFSDFGFIKLNENNNETILHLPVSSEILDDELISISFE